MHRYGVRRIEFEPLLSTAGLEKEEDGYVMSVNTEAAGANRKEGMALEISAETCLSLNTALRFTLAHELAHLVLLSIADHRLDVFSEHDEELEVLCNSLAAAILLPKSRFLQDVAARIFDTVAVKQALRDYRVSPEVLIWRIQSRDISVADLNMALGELDGMIALLRAQHEGIVVAATYNRGPLARHRWPTVSNVRQRVPAEKLLLDSNVFGRIATVEFNQEKTDVVWRADAGQTIPCELNSCRLYSSPLALLLAVRVTGGPEVTQQT